jgi:hypothetical protein
MSARTHGRENTFSKKKRGKQTKLDIGCSMGCVRASGFLRSVLLQAVSRIPNV